MARTHVVLADEVVEAVDRLVGRRTRPQPLPRGKEHERNSHESSSKQRSWRPPDLSASLAIPNGVIGARRLSGCDTRAPDGSLVTRYLLDTTVLIAHLRGDDEVERMLLELLGDGHSLGTSCVNIAELNAGCVQRSESGPGSCSIGWRSSTPRARANARRSLSKRLGSPGTNDPHTRRADSGHCACAGAVLLTDNLDDFPIRERTRVDHPTADENERSASGAARAIAHRSHIRRRPGTDMATPLAHANGRAAARLA